MTLPKATTMVTECHDDGGLSLEVTASAEQMPSTWTITGLCH